MTAVPPANQSEKILKNESSAKDQQQPLRPVFLVRMSAIGDTILAARVHQDVRKKGHSPFLITHANNASLLNCMPQLEGACLQSENGLHFFLRDESTKKISEVDKDFFLKKIRDGVSQYSETEKIILADLQATRRSRRALKLIKAVLAEEKIRTQSLRVKKLTFWRLVFVILSFFYRKQWSRRSVPNWLQRKLKSVHRLQREVVNKIPEATSLSSHHQEPNVLAAPYEELQKRRTQSGESKHVFILIGASYRLKTWPREHWRKLIEIILTRTELKIVLCGGPGERAVAEYLEFLDNKRIENLVGKTTLSETLSWIQTACYVVTGDSFASHAADLLRTPASVLFGATHPLLGFAPEAEHINVHHSALSCSPCSRHGQGECRFKNIRCLTSIEPEEVFSKIEQKLRSSEPRN